MIESGARLGVLLHAKAAKGRLDGRQVPGRWHDQVDGQLGFEVANATLDVAVVAGGEGFGVGFRWEG